MMSKMSLRDEQGELAKAKCVPCKGTWKAGHGDLTRHGSITRMMNKVVKREVAKAEAAKGNTNGIF